MLVLRNVIIGLTGFGYRKLDRLERLTRARSLPGWTADSKETTEARSNLPYGQLPLIKGHRDQSPTVGTERYRSYLMKVSLEDVYPGCSLEVVPGAVFGSASYCTTGRKELLT